ncbi:OLC1v1020192C1 [Oldenlandia corymbosa var. corymbosa]|uniref:OLC1v1020192C1 n=1 Tax=Oldenlandia corymbosa var. corymbosa TaxID=529605 RepID=A0AAV1EFX6_OLDCO|nr:OLC1v1020192C1 [Oldenlandia corymbosa var. corymbosa]
MASIWIPFCLVVVLGLNFMRKWIKGSNNEVKKKLPPGPRKLPLIGNMHHLMGSLPHHALTKLAKKHGDLMHLQLGEISAIVVSSPRVAKTVLKSHDTAVSNRPDFLVGRIIFYDYSDLGFAPYGDYWRQLRKICTLELLSTKSVRSFASIRQDEVSKLVSSIREEALFEQRKQGTNLTRKVSSYTISMISRAAFGRAFERHQEKLAELMREVLFRMSGFDASDLFPSWKVLQHLSLMKPKLMELRSRADEILDVIIQDHVENPTGKNGEFGQEDLIDVLLRIKQGGGDYNFPLTNTNIKANMEVPLTNLLYHFDWNLPNDIITTGLDMTESYGITAAMKNDLFLVPSPL